ncbi:MAG: Ppx/GppA phosphatase family protein [Chloroflexota bacterium]
MGEITQRAVIDIGSNTIRLLVARMGGDSMTTVLDMSQFVRLGFGVESTGELNSEREEAGIEAIKKLVGRASEVGSDRVTAFATSAIRDASNGPDFARRIEQETGVEVEIISGLREAQLTARGATLGLAISGETVIADLGGGSIEIIGLKAGNGGWARSLRLGSGKMTDRFVVRDPPGSAAIRSVALYVQKDLQELPPIDAQNVIFTGGTATHMARLAGQNGVSVRLERDALIEVLETVTTTPAEEVAARYHIRKERAEILPAGIATLVSLATFYGVSHVMVTRRGVREGALLERADREAAGEPEGGPDSN